MFQEQVLDRVYGSRIAGRLTLDVGHISRSLLTFVALVGREAHRVFPWGGIVVLSRYGEMPAAVFKDGTRCVTPKPIVILEELLAHRGVEEDRGPGRGVNVRIWQSHYFRLRRYQAEIQVAHHEADVGKLLARQFFLQPGQMLIEFFFFLFGAQVRAHKDQSDTLVTR